MTSPLCKYCGRKIVHHQYCIEKPGQYEERLASGYCRRKCERLDKPSPYAKDRPTLVADPTAWNYERREGKEQPKEKPVRDAARLAFARSMVCCVCGAVEGVHAHHENEPAKSTMAGKCSDRRTVPLCPKCHFLRHSLGRSFYKNTDIEFIVLEINTAYDILCQSKQCS